jgi:uncharacterized protein with HEPN domain
MDNEKNDKFYLEKVVSDLNFIIEKTKNKTQFELEENEILVDSIMFRLIQMAENIEKLSIEFKMKHNYFPWKAIKGMRNKIVHNYGVVDMWIVYNTITNDLPNFYNQLTKILVSI